MLSGRLQKEQISDSLILIRFSHWFIEAKFKLYGNTLSELKKELIKIEDRVTNVENDSGMHGNMLQQLASIWLNCMVMIEMTMV